MDSPLLRPPLTWGLLALLVSFVVQRLLVQRAFSGLDDAARATFVRVSTRRGVLPLLGFCAGMGVVLLWPRVGFLLAAPALALAGEPGARRLRAEGFPGDALRVLRAARLALALGVAAWGAAVWAALAP